MWRSAACLGPIPQKQRKKPETSLIASALALGKPFYGHYLLLD
jgi:hypothetical protein